MPADAKAAAGTSNAFWMFAEEIKAINERRAALGIPKHPEITGNDPGKVIDVTGLALSGGGVRSASLCLGVLQALQHHDALRNIDYLSTVSGGGYMGASLTATMTKANRFVFAGPRKVLAPGSAPPNDISDTDEVGHIRNYSNYLIPFGPRDLLTGFAIVTRGLVANLALVLPFVLIAAGATIWSNPDREALQRPDIFGLSLQDYWPVSYFGITLALALLGLLLFLMWALYRSILRPDRLQEFRTKLPALGAAYLVLLAVSLFCELQPFVVAGMFDMADQQGGQQGVLLGVATSWVKTLAAITTPITAVILFFRKQFGDILKAANATSDLLTRFLGFLVKAAIWVAGAALPLLIWVGYLYLCYWGTINCLPSLAEAGAIPARAVLAAAEIQSEAQKLPLARRDCLRLTDTGMINLVPSGDHTPYWLLATANLWSEMARSLIDRAPGLSPELEQALQRFTNRPFIPMYFTTGVLLFLISWRLKPNANSLHRLYRDRISKAFLFDPTSRPDPSGTSMDMGRDYAPLDTMRLSELSSAHAPYHLINAALNVQGSDYANRRGRNADFFLFSKLSVGSEATGYARTADVERDSPGLDLATAVAISGAAASSNMGAKSIRPLTFTLAVLNIRLGYWLKNPASRLGRLRKRSWWAMPRSTLFLWSEISGRLSENDPAVYVTDGGHIENLGVYELLRRRCRVIVVVDAEADFALHFPSLITLQRHARIDLGVRINLPWGPIQDTTLAMMGSTPDGSGKKPRPKPKRGPHIAIGTIDYGDDTGYLVYVKSSLTGDENDYVLDYSRRFDRFPHESTGDQFFSEEQLEVYCALGFHMMHEMLCGGDHIEVVGAPAGTTVTFNDVDNPVIKAVRDRLMRQPAP